MSGLCSPTQPLTKEGAWPHNQPSESNMWGTRLLPHVHRPRNISNTSEYTYTIYTHKLHEFEWRFYALSASILIYIQGENIQSYNLSSPVMMIT